ncbi:MAG: EF-P lysine aminoacylase EpmA, partial [Motiliproteus sp.]|nr:EF-P lysine aminoacylase EpmA [Motiliproteus sp.]
MADWQPSAGLDQIRARAELYRTVREFFSERQVLEVETPILSAAAVADPHLDPLRSSYRGPGQQGLQLFLQTSPEYPMKRLLAAGSGPIYQICKSFRNGESGRRHNPEFTMLEWYRPGFDDRQLMAEVEALLLAVCGCSSARYISYRQLFIEHLQIDPHPADAMQLQKIAQQHLDIDLQLDDRDGWLDLLFSHLIEPRLQQATFVFDYPETQAALAQVCEDEAGVKVARRFELFVQGIELANGY